MSDRLRGTEERRASVTEGVAPAFLDVQLHADKMTPGWMVDSAGRLYNVIDRLAAILARLLVPTSEPTISAQTTSASRTLILADGARARLLGVSVTAVGGGGDIYLLIADAAPAAGNIIASDAVGVVGHRPITDLGMTDAIVEGPIYATCSAAGDAFRVIIQPVG